MTSPGPAPAAPVPPPSWTEPDEWHAPATYWFWHRVPTPDEIRAQVGRIADAGYKAFQIQARMAFPLADYLSPAYLAACRLAADEAARRGLAIGVYDEYNWLSGHAGGRTVEGRGDLRERHLFWSTSRGPECTVDGIRPTDVEYLLDPGMNWVFEGGEPRWDEWEIVAALVHDGADVRDVTADARLTAATGEGATAAVPPEAVPPGSSLTVFLAARCATSRMINYLLPEAAERFLDVSYEPYAEAFGPHFGTTVKYAFFDQPHACFFRWRQHEGHVGSSLMYAPGLVSSRTSLLDLVYDVGPETAARRCDFFEAYAARGIESFFGTLARWCREHGIELSGHEVLGYVSTWDPTSTIVADDARANFGADHFGLDRFRDRTAVDARNEHPQVSAKFGDSVARSSGRDRTIVEQYFARTLAGTHFGTGRWELTLRDLRAAAIRHHLLGARQILMHAFWQTDGDDREEIFANPRFDFAPGVNYEPWFPYHRAFAEESGRLSAFLDGARPRTDVAVLYPLRTAWAGGPSHPYGEHVAFWTEHLAREGYGFHLIDERDLRSARSADGHLVLGDRRYRVLVLPAASVVEDGATIAAVNAFTDAGGVLLVSGGPPARTQRSGDAGPLSPAASWPSLPTAAEADARLRPHLPRTVEADDPSRTVWRYEARDAYGTRLALFNDTGVPRTVTVRPPSLPSRLTRWHADTGEIDPPVPVGGALRLTLGPWELACLHLADGPAEVPRDLVLDSGWTLAADGPARPVRVDEGWERQGLPRFSGVGDYATAFDVPDGRTDWTEQAGWADGTGWELHVPEVCTSAEIVLNGTSLGRFGWGPITCPVPAGLLRPSGNDLHVLVASSAANRYYAGTSQQKGLDPSGLTAPPVLRPALTVTAAP